jgi:tripartite-type tricarboxylate transporter receptor subunit TctC
MQYGSAGGGSATHVSCVLLNVAIGVDVTHVPYRGTGPAMQDLMGGRIDYICDVISTALPLIRSKAVKAIALLSPQRSSVLPELATAQEQGLAGFDTDGWNAFFLPRGTPEPIVRRLAKATSDALDLPWVRERLEGLGLNVTPPERRTPAYLAKLVPSELVKWADAEGKRSRGRRLMLASAHALDRRLTSSMRRNRRWQRRRHWRSRR